MKPLHIILIVCGGLLVLLALFIIGVRLANRKRFNRLQKNLSKIEKEKEDFENDHRLNFDNSFEHVEEEKSPVVEDYMEESIEEEIADENVLREETLFDEIQEDIVESDNKDDYQQIRRKRDKEFNDFLNHHAFSRKILDKDLLKKFKNLSPEMKSLLLNSIFEKYDDKKQ